LYWGGAQGLKGRWLVTQKAWMNAYSAGKEGHRHLEKALKLDPALHDADLGLGIYDYYTAVLPGFMGALSKMIMHGDRKRGLQELETAIHKGPHSRVEAMVFLIEIYANEEHQPAKALPLAHQLRQEFPQSAAMQTSEILVLNQLHRWSDAEKEAQDMLDKAMQKKNYYTEKDADIGRYLVGLAALMGDHDLKKCRAMLNPLIEKADHSPSRWITFALLRRGQSYDADHDRAKAKADYERVLARPDVWDSHAEATRFLAKAFAG
jgi:predicted Zn-dependent protease